MIESLGKTSEHKLDILPRTNIYPIQQGEWIKLQKHCHAGRNGHKQNSVTKCAFCTNDNIFLQGRSKKRFDEESDKYDMYCIGKNSDGWAIQSIWQLESHLQSKKTYGAESKRNSRNVASILDCTYDRLTLQWTGKKRQIAKVTVLLRLRLRLETSIQCRNTKVPFALMLHTDNVLIPSRKTFLRPLKKKDVHKCHQLFF